MALTLITPPAQEPVSPEDVQAFLRVEDSGELGVLNSLIVAARQSIDGRDGWLGRALVTQTWEWTLDRFPVGCRPLEVPLPPLQSVTSIAYVDPAGVLQTWDPAAYQVDTASEPGRIAPAVDHSYPTTRETFGAVRVRFVAGYGDPSQVPAAIKLGLMQLVAHWYEHREPIITGTTVAEVPSHVDAVLAPYRVWAGMF